MDWNRAQELPVGARVQSVFGGEIWKVQRHQYEVTYSLGESCDNPCAHCTYTVHLMRLVHLTRPNGHCSISQETARFYEKKT